MNKTVLIAGAAVLGLLALGAVLWVTRNNSSNTPTAMPEATDSMQTQGTSFNGTFLDLLRQGQSQMCTFDSVDEKNVRTEGVIFVEAGGNRLSSNFSVEQPEGDFEGNIIRDGEYTYIWTTLQEQGVKLKITPESEELFGSIGESEDNSTGISDTTEVDFSCSPWAVEESIFQAPSDIEFMDVTEAFEQFQDMPAANQCAACSQLPEGEVRNQCLTALNCE